MDSASPYRPPAAGPPPVPRYGSLVPQSVKVFGVMHLILAGLGLLATCFSVATMLMGPLFISTKDPSYQAQLHFQAETRGATAFSLVVTVVLTVLLLISGIKLVKPRPDGVKWSARYSLTSIASKLVMIVVGFVWILPATRQLMHETFGAQMGPGSGGAKAMMPFVDLIAIASTVLSPVISCLYPGLALYFLSRPPVKAWSEAALSRPDAS